MVIPTTAPVAGATDLLPQEMSRDPSSMRSNPMLVEIDTLPGAQRRPATYDG